MAASRSSSGARRACSATQRGVAQMQTVPPPGRLESGELREAKEGDRKLGWQVLPVPNFPSGCERRIIRVYSCPLQRRRRLYGPSVVSGE